VGGEGCVHLAHSLQHDDDHETHAAANSAFGDVTLHLSSHIHTVWLISTLQCWGLIFSNFTAQAHAANIWVNPKAPDADALVVDRHFLQAHWYLMLVW
jgi:hypothetical protein